MNKYLMCEYVIIYIFLRYISDLKSILHQWYFKYLTFIDSRDYEFECVLKIHVLKI